MQIETKWNVGDKVWGVTSVWLHPDAACAACRGKGGAHIPKTRVWAECQECEGRGEVQGEVHEYYATEEVVSRIEIVIEEAEGDPEITYSFMQHIEEVA